ncbi:MAG: putative ABC transporter permease, partial [Spirochaetia bacterium]
MEHINELLVYFLIYGYLGWVFECAFAAIKTGHLVKRRGAFTNYFLPLYGLCSVLIILIFQKVDQPIGAAVASGLVITILEYGVGWYLYERMGLKLWDYSEVWGNVKGYICIPFTILWCGLAFIVANSVHPLLVLVQGQITASGQWVIIGIG